MQQQLSFIPILKMTNNSKYQGCLNLSNKRVMTTEWVEGIPVGDLDLLKSKNIDLKKLSELIIQSFLNNLP